MRICLLAILVISINAYGGPPSALEMLRIEFVSVTENNEHLELIKRSRNVEEESPMPIFKTCLSTFTKPIYYLY